MANNSLPTPHASLSEAYATSAEATGHYITNSDAGWGTYDSGITGENGYDETFSGVLGGKSILEIVRPRPDSPFIAVDLMASTTALQEMFDHLPDDVEKRGFAVSLADRRPDALQRRNEQSGIRQLTGDLARSATFRKLKTDMNGQANMVLARSDLGVTCLPRHRSYHAAVFNQIWGMLAIDGIGLLELPSPMTTALAGGSVDYLMDRLQDQHVLAALDLGKRALYATKSPWNAGKLELA